MSQADLKKMVSELGLTGLSKETKAGGRLVNALVKFGQGESTQFKTEPEAAPTPKTADEVSELIAAFRAGGDQSTIARRGDGAYRASECG